MNNENISMNMGMPQTQQTNVSMNLGSPNIQQLEALVPASVSAAAIATTMTGPSDTSNTMVCAPLSTILPALASLQAPQVPQAPKTPEAPPQVNTGLRRSTRAPKPKINTNTIVPKTRVVKTKTKTKKQLQQEVTITREEKLRTKYTDILRDRFISADDREGYLISEFEGEIPEELNKLIEDSRSIEEGRSTIDEFAVDPSEQLVDNAVELLIAKKMEESSNTSNNSNNSNNSKNTNQLNMFGGKRRSRKLRKSRRKHTKKNRRSK